MSSNKDAEHTLNKMKQYFRNMKTIKENNDRNEDFTITHPITKAHSAEIRCKALKELGVVISLSHLDDNTIMNVVEITKDLLNSNNSVEHRHATLLFYRQLIDSQIENLSLMRTHFFNIIRDKNIGPEDIKYKLELFRSLTKNGRNIQYFEEEIGPFVCEWMQHCLQINLTIDFLNILINLIKFNAAYLDENIVADIVRDVCVLICLNIDVDTVMVCLTVFETVICYSILPSSVLSTLINTLCRTINCESFCNKSWKIMRNLLGTNLGHASLLTLCYILNNRILYNDEALLRGAVFYINMSLWGGSSIVPILNCTPSAVLLSFRNALKRGHLIVTYEVALSMETLIQKRSAELGEPAWDVICEILSQIAINIDNLKLSKENGVVIHFHDILDKIEGLISKDAINMDPNKFFSLIENIHETRSEQSVKNLMNYKLTSILATRPHWLEALDDFMKIFFKNSTNHNIRLYAIEKLLHIINCNRITYEDEIIENILLVHFSNIAQENDIIIKIAVLNLLIDFFLHCDTNKCLELLGIMNKIMNRPFEKNIDIGISLETENGISDINLVVAGLIRVFLIKIYQASSHAVNVFDLLLQHWEKHYDYNSAFSITSKIRFEIISWILKIRSNSLFHIGYPDNLLHSGTIKYSHYVSIDDNSKISVTTEKTQNRDKISFRRAFLLIIRALQNEKNWDILQVILKELPNLMQNKSVVPVSDVDLLAKTIYTLFVDKTYYEKIQMKPQFSDFQAIVLSTMCGLTMYHQYLDTTTQKKIFEMLKYGFSSRMSRLCVQTLGILILEMPDTLARQLPEILFEMSKMSNTITLSIPVLEFLSSLNRLPNDRFRNFTETQCMYVFAITLPYTNPYRFNHYIVSLAHHVLAGWFLKCRLPIRKGLVDYVVKGLESNVRMPLEENKSQHHPSTPGNESVHGRSNSVSGSIDNDNLYNFHMELAETFIDFMARHTFSPCSALPKRSDDHLFVGGQSSTWLVGHNIITITTTPDRTITPYRMSSTSSIRDSKTTRNVNSTFRRDAVVNSQENSSTTNKYTLPVSISPKTGWAQIYIRRPTGSISWIMRIDDKFLNEFPLEHLNSLFNAYDIGTSTKAPEIPLYVEKSSKDIIGSDKFDKNELKKVSNSISDEITTDYIEISMGPRDAKHNISNDGSNLNVSTDSEPINIPHNSNDRRYSEDDDSTLNKTDEIYCDVFDNPKEKPVRRINSSPEMHYPCEIENINMETVSTKDRVQPMQMRKSTSHLNISDVVDSPKPKDDLNFDKKIIPNLNKTAEQKTPSKSSNVHVVDVTPKKESNEKLLTPQRKLVNSANKTTSISSEKNQFDRNYRRERSKTISFVQEYSNNNDVSKLREQQNGLNPSFIFLQLYHRGQASDFPIKVNPCNKKSIDLLDLIPPFEIHKIGVLYVGPGQCNNQVEILKNRFGSMRFAEFLKNIGTLVPIDEAKENNIFIDLVYENDGHFAYIWQNDIVQVTFHVATLMPNKKQDPQCNEKKKHIGNDFVTIVYNESQEEFNINTMKGQFNYASVIVQPMELNTNKIFLIAKQEVTEYICSSESKIVSDKSAPLLARQMALHANLASLVSKSLLTRFSNSPYASNWLERLRGIKKLRNKLEKDQSSTDGSSSWW